MSYLPPSGKSVIMDAKSNEKGRHTVQLSIGGQDLNLFISTYESKVSVVSK